MMTTTDETTWRLSNLHIVTALLQYMLAVFVYLCLFFVSPLALMLRNSG